MNLLKDRNISGMILLCLKELLKGLSDYIDIVSGNRDRRYKKKQDVYKNRSAHMIHPDKVAIEAKKKEDENFKFQTFLKGHADEEELDKQFLRLHQELFTGYDCSKCRNCCKMYNGTIPREDVERDAEYLGITAEQFKTFFLENDEYGDGYRTKHKPCDFLQEDGNCRLGNCKPDSCKKYPYTDQPERIWSLLGMLDIVAVCPVAFEIFERLKKEYGFRRR